MRATQEDIERLQALLDSSIERAGAFLRRSFFTTLKRRFD
jgi:hypothetical protein